MEFVPEIRQGQRGAQKLNRYIGSKHGMNRLNGKPVNVQERDIDIEKRNRESSMTAESRLKAQQED